ncbi:MAG: hypothetical protein ABSF24_01755 [Candidatus Bathyarchaeia archaeon]
MTTKKADDYLFEITCFVIASAERAIGPESGYGACRLVQTLYMLSFLPDYVDMKGNDLLMRVRAYVDADTQNFWREPQLKQFLAELSQQLAKEIKKQKNLEK